MPKFHLLLLDAGVVIGAHELGVWDQLLGNLSIIWRKRYMSMRSREPIIQGRRPACIGPMDALATTRLSTQNRARPVNRLLSIRHWSCTERILTESALRMDNCV